MTAPAQRRTVEELAVVELTVDVTNEEGLRIPEGTRGVVVIALPGGSACEVDFEHPHQGLATVENRKLRVVDAAPA